MTTTPRFLFSLAVLAPIALGGAAPAGAQQDREVPYWAALRVGEVNMRVGPGEDYRIAWVYKRKQLPMKVLRLKEGWRLVQDPEGARGWMLARFLTPERGALVIGDGLAEMHEKGSESARLLWRVEPGVTGKLGDCDDGWCKFEVSGHVGFMPEDRLWGAGTP
jgi:SH3-like domain-containing protein